MHFSLPLLSDGKENIGSRCFSCMLPASISAYFQHPVEHLSKIFRENDTVIFSLFVLVVLRQYNAIISALNVPKA